jgi:predicted amidohydrolase YtcJ
VVAELLVRGAMVEGRLSDVRCADGRIVEVGPRLGRRPGEEVIEAGGGQAVPGLVDHHIHLRALAAAGASVVAGPPQVTTPARLAAALTAADAALAPGEWIRAIGYHESVAGPLDAAALDALVTRGATTAPRPVRLQHRSGSLWMLNSAALAILNIAAWRGEGVERDLAERPTGRLWRMDAWLGERIGHRPGDLGSVSQAAAAAGVTGFTDATPDRSQDETDDLVGASDEGLIVQRLCLMTPRGVGLPAAHHPGAHHPGAHRSGARQLGRPSLVELGAVKILLDDATLPSLDDLVAQMNAAHTLGRAVAVHCVTYLQLVVTLAALQVGAPHPGDRIEHGALIGQAQIATLRTMGLVVVTQPGLLAARGDEYRREIDPGDLDDLWRLGSLRRGGVAVAIGTDAPFGPADPWAALRAARDRRTPLGAVLSPSERIDGPQALRLMATAPGRPGQARRLAAGQVADICILRGTVADALDAPRPVPVGHTVVAGRLVFSS